MLFITATLLLCSGAPIDFDAQKAKAQEVESIEKAMVALIGDCSKADFENATECQKNLAAQSKALRSKPQYIDIGPVEDATLQFVGEQRSGLTRLLWVPIVDVDGMGFTLKKPMGLSKNGGPRLKKMVLDAELQNGMFASELQRAVRLSMVNVEVIGRFGKTWNLKKGAHSARGIVFKADYIRLTNTRNGKTMATIKVK